jgi:hypothetical protein
VAGDSLPAWPRRNWRRRPDVLARRPRTRRAGAAGFPVLRDLPAGAETDLGGRQSRS